jgi:adenine-specific DNA-methyltransferase
VNGKSLDIKQKNLETLCELFPHIFSEDKLDLEKFKAAFHDDIDFANERYTLNWAGKSDAFKILQEGTTATLKPQPELSVNFNATENVFIEGENLEVLKILQKSYYNKIKCIIIDPPYNTGSDSFIYPDRFKENLEDYEKRVGERDEEGYLMKEGLFRKNSRENGHYHSNWLNMMLPRLFLARNLLRDDGVIFVHIDDNEVHNLRLLMNEIFGEENFIAQIIWERSYAPINLKKHFSESHDYILCYARQIDNLICYGLPRPESTNSKYGNPDNDPRGLWRTDNLSVGPAIPEKIYEIITPSGRKVLPPKGRCWVYTKERYEEMVADNRIWFGEDGNNVPAPKRFLNEVKQGLTPMTVWKHSEVGHNQDSMRELRELFEGEKIFDYSKPVKLIKQLISLYSQKDDFILDFFAGSGTTAHAVLDLNKEDNGNRKFILVQLPELCNEDSEAYKAGYKTIADISRERIRRVIQKIGEGGFKAYKLSPSNFKIWRSEEITEENLEKQMEMFIDPVKPESVVENMLVELMLKSGYQLTDNVENRGDFYYINNELVIALTKMDLEIATKIIALQPQKVITLDRLFAGNDELKTNTALQMRDAGVELRTI